MLRLYKQLYECTHGSGVVYFKVDLKLIGAFDSGKFSLIIELILVISAIIAGKI